MNKVWKICKMPLFVALIATGLYLIDLFLGPALFKNGSFLWVAFLSWTIFGSASLKERVQAIIGNVIGFGFALLMFHSKSYFPGNIGIISISSLLILFLANFGMMFFVHFKKVWMNSIGGIFLSVSLTFSGLGVQLYPTSVSNAFLLLSIILIYGVLGLIAGWINKYLSDKENKNNSNNEIKQTPESTN